MDYVYLFAIMATIIGFGIWIGYHSYRRNNNKR